MGLKNKITACSLLLDLLILKTKKLLFKKENYCAAFCLKMYGHMVSLDFYGCILHTTNTCSYRPHEKSPNFFCLKREKEAKISVQETKHTAWIKPWDKTAAPEFDPTPVPLRLNTLKTKINSREIWHLLRPKPDTYRLFGAEQVPSPLKSVSHKKMVLS